MILLWEIDNLSNEVEKEIGKEPDDSDNPFIKKNSVITFSNIEFLFKSSVF